MSSTCIVIPTYNEAENIVALIRAIWDTGIDFQLIIVDDNSPDGTARIVEEMKKTSASIMIKRRPEKLGIGSAICDGLKLALSVPECIRIVTMDADLSHDPRDIPRLLEASIDADMVQGSRYIEGGRIIGWNIARKVISRCANLLYKHLFGLCNEVTTYFRVYSRRCAEIVVDNNHADQYHFSVASALTVKDAGMIVKEVPVTFTNRKSGKSKLSKGAIFESFLYMIRTFLQRSLFGRDNPFVRFCIVGAIGFLINEGLLWILAGMLGIYYLYAAVVGIELSIVSNYILNTVWTFKGNMQEDSKLKGFFRYNLVCLAGVAINLIVLWLLTEFAGLHYLISNIFGIACGVLWNYSASVRWIWHR